MRNPRSSCWPGYEARLTAVFASRSHPECNIHCVVHEISARDQELMSGEDETHGTLNLTYAAYTAKVFWCYILQHTNYGIQRTLGFSSYTASCNKRLYRVRRRLLHCVRPQRSVPSILEL